MKQLRIKSHTGSSPQMSATCQTNYKSLNEEKDSFQPGWMQINQTIHRYSLLTHQAF